MEFAAFDHVEWLAKAWEHGAPKHDLGSSAFAAPWTGRLDLPMVEKDLSWMDLSPETPLRAALAKRWDMPKDQIIVTAGTSGANLAVLMTYIRPGCNVVCERPYYAPLPILAKGLGAEVRYVDRDPASGWRLNPSSVAEQVDENTALIVLTSPDNPTGAVTSQEDFTALGTIAQNVGARVLVDQIYRELTDHPIAAKAHAACITTSGFNKCWGAPGLRTGWLAASEDDAERIMPVHRLAVLTAPEAGARVAQWLIEQENEARTLMEDCLNTSQPIIQNWAKEHGYALETVGMTAFVDMGQDSQTLAKAALAAGVLVIPGDGFGWPGRVRIGLGIDAKRLKDGLEALAGVNSRRPAQTF